MTRRFASAQARLAGGRRPPRWLGRCGSLDWPMRALQRLIGERRMPYVFLLPNLVFFGLFVFLPIVINFVFSVTGGTALFPSRASLRRRRANTPTCSTAAPILDPEHLPRGPFLARRRQYAQFIVFQVVAMVLLSLLTAIVLNMKIRGARLLPRRLLLPGPAVARRRRADLEMDPAARRPAQRRHHRARRRARSCSSSNPAGRCSGWSSSRSGPIWASTR